MTPEIMAQIQEKGFKPQKRRQRVKAQLPTPSESNIVHACLDYLCKLGCDVMRCNTGGALREYTLKSTGQKKRYNIRFGKRGAGDILACSPTGRWIEVECKRADGEQRTAQIQRQQDIERRGGLYILARSVDDLEARREEIIA